MSNDNVDSVISTSGNESTDLPQQQLEPPKLSKNQKKNLKRREREKKKKIVTPFESENESTTSTPTEEIAITLSEATNQSASIKEPSSRELKDDIKFELKVESQNPENSSPELVPQLNDESVLGASQELKQAFAKDDEIHLEKNTSVNNKEAFVSTSDIIDRNSNSIKNGNLEESLFPVRTKELGETEQSQELQFTKDEFTETHFERTDFGVNDSESQHKDKTGFALQEEETTVVNKEPEGSFGNATKHTSTSWDQEGLGQNQQSIEQQYLQFNSENASSSSGVYDEIISKPAENLFTNDKISTDDLFGQNNNSDEDFTAIISQNDIVQPCEKTEYYQSEETIQSQNFSLDNRSPNDDQLATKVKNDNYNSSETTPKVDSSVQNQNENGMFSEDPDKLESTDKITSEETAKLEPHDNLFGASNSIKNSGGDLWNNDSLNDDFTPLIRQDKSSEVTKNLNKFAFLDDELLEDDELEKVTNPSTKPSLVAESQESEKVSSHVNYKPFSYQPLSYPHEQNRGQMQPVLSPVSNLFNNPSKSQLSQENHLDIKKLNENKKKSDAYDFPIELMPTKSIQKSVRVSSNQAPLPAESPVLPHSNANLSQSGSKNPYAPPSLSAAVKNAYEQPDSSVSYTTDTYNRRSTSSTGFVPGAKPQNLRKKQSSFFEELPVTIPRPASRAKKPLTNLSGPATPNIGPALLNAHNRYAQPSELPVSNNRIDNPFQSVKSGPPKLPVAGKYSPALAQPGPHSALAQSSQTSTPTQLTTYGSQVNQSPQVHEQVSGSSFGNSESLQQSTTAFVSPVDQVSEGSQNPQHQQRNTYTATPQLQGFGSSQTYNQTAPPITANIIGGTNGITDVSQESKFSYPQSNPYQPASGSHFQNPALSPLISQASLSQQHGPKGFKNETLGIDTTLFNSTPVTPSLSASKYAPINHKRQTSITANQYDPYSLSKFQNQQKQSFQAPAGNLPLVNQNISGYEAVVEEEVSSRQFPLFSWSNGPNVASYVPSSSYLLSKGIKISKIENILTDSLLKEFPFATKKNIPSIIKFLERRIDFLSTHTPSKSNEDELSLAQLLKFKISKESGNFNFGGIINYVEPLDSQLDKRFDQNTSILNKSHFVSLILNGQKDQAINLALNHQNYALALIIASTIGKKHWANIVERYLGSEFSGDNDSFISTLFQILSGNVEKVIKSFEVSDQKRLWAVNNWRALTNAVIANSTDLPFEFLNEFSSFLIRNKELTAGYILLITADAPLSTFKPSSSVKLGVYLEIYGLFLTENKFPVDLSLVHLQHAYNLTDHQLLSEAQKYLDLAAVSIKNSSNSKNRSIGFSWNTLNERLSGENGAELGWFGRPKLDKVWGHLDKSLNKFISGDEVKDDGKDTVFSKFSPSSSRNSSNISLHNASQVTGNNFRNGRMPFEQSVSASSDHIHAQNTYHPNQLLSNHTHDEGNKNNVNFSAVSQGVFDEKKPYTPPVISRKTSIIATIDNAALHTQPPLAPTSNSYNASPKVSAPLTKTSTAKYSASPNIRSSRYEPTSARPPNHLDTIQHGEGLISRPFSGGLNQSDNFTTTKFDYQPSAFQAHNSRRSSVQSIVGVEVSKDRSSTAQLSSQLISPEKVEKTRNTQHLPLTQEPLSKDNSEDVNKHLSPDDSKLLEPVSIKRYDESEFNDQVSAYNKDGHDSVGLGISQEGKLDSINNSVYNTDVLTILPSESSESAFYQKGTDIGSQEASEAISFVGELNSVTNDSIRDNNSGSSVAIPFHPSPSKQITPSTSKKDSDVTGELNDTEGQATDDADEETALHFDRQDKQKFKSDDLETKALKPDENFVEENETKRVFQSKDFPPGIAGTPSHTFAHQKPLAKNPYAPREVSPYNFNHPDSTSKQADPKRSSSSTRFIPKPQVSADPNNFSSKEMEASQSVSFSSNGGFNPHVLPNSSEELKAFSSVSPPLTSNFDPVDTSSRNSSSLYASNPYAPPLVHQNDSTLQESSFSVTDNNEEPSEERKLNFTPYQPSSAFEAGSRNDQQRDLAKTSSIPAFSDLSTNVTAYEPPASSHKINNAPEEDEEYYDDIVEDEEDSDDENELTKKPEKEKKDDFSDKGPAGWFGWLRNNKNEQKVYRAKLGNENRFYYDEELKKWVNKDADPEDEKASASAPPPPPIIKKIPSSISTPRSGSLGESNSLKTESSAGAPLSITSGPGQVLKPGGLSNSGGPQIKKASAASVSDLDSLMNLNVSSSATRKKKRGGRGYVDVMGSMRN
ncbi:hypothetical protein WICMUC_001027 [Wickerhamomyces mucosus]|uniref:COPII coat assembly protein SEC16 n=1 Tax=Wickerhamomyces mucosus TaxID=1378264 RepID=A0A9P8PXI3_9ASCO|nr:hypothetical protein WICMUC_001027 [Wickerhamomyces mucosus]